MGQYDQNRAQCTDVASWTPSLQARCAAYHLGTQIMVSWTYFNYSSLFFAGRSLHTTQFGSFSIHSLTRDRAAQSTVAMFILTFFSQTKHNIRNVINIKTLFVSFLNFSCGYVNIWLVSHIGCPSGWSQPGTDRPARRACGRRPVCSSLNRFEGTRLRRC